MMIETHIQVSLAWGVLMIIYFSGELLRIYRVDDINYSTGTTQFRQPIQLSISTLMIVPILMIILILMFYQPISRWANIVMAGFIVLIHLMGLPEDMTVLDKFSIFVGLTLNLVTFWLIWNLAI